MPSLALLDDLWSLPAPVLWTAGLALAALGLWGSSRRATEARRRTPRTPAEQAAAVALMPQAEPGAWQVRCTHCEGTAAAAAMGVLRLGALARKWLLGRCPFCDRFRCLAIERTPGRR